MGPERTKATFKSGQWVDIVIPGVSTVGGFSLVSTPQFLSKTNQVDLAVKYSDHPPAKWIHEKCSIGNEVEIKFGGDFYFEPKQDKSDLLLIAGGVGINPLFAIFEEVAESESYDGRVMLMVSAKSEGELLFKSDIIERCNAAVKLNGMFFVTGQVESLIASKIGEDINFGQIAKQDIENAIRKANLEHGKTKCFLCGPKSMVDSMEFVLCGLGIEKKNISYENWW